jgi:hypothetical protein
LYETLIAQLDQFIRKFYLSKIFKGILLFSGSIITLYLLLSIGEFAFYFPSWLRWILVISFLGIALLSMINWMLIPLSKYLKISNGLSYEQAAQIIGQHFTEVQDKLLNILQLKSEHATSGSQELLEASIAQKAKQISWVPFNNAVDLKENKKFLRYAIPPLILLLGIILIAPNILKESNARLSQPSKAFSKPAPFEFIIEEANLKVKQFGDAEIVVKVKGKTLPTKLEWVQNEQNYPLIQKDANTFVYQATNVVENTKFRILANGYFSKVYILQVLKKPVVSSMEVLLEFPSYIKRKNETLQNSGDLIVPVGTKINWKFSAKNTQKVALKFSNESLTWLQQDNQHFTFHKTATDNLTYKLFAFNEDMPHGDSVQYSISVVEDQYPAIQVNQLIDRTQKDVLFFMGNVSDDYSVTRLAFNASIINEKNQIRKTIQTNIPVSNSDIADFTHHISISTFQLQAGEKLEYYFTVWDNDAIHGSKSTKSNIFTYTLPTIAEYKNIEQSNNQNIKSSLQSSSKEVQKLSKELQSFKEKVATKKNLSWEDKKEAEELLSKHEELQKEIQDIKDKYDENLKNQENFKEVAPEILEKQELLTKMMDELLSQEMKDLMKQLEELLDKFQEKNAFDKLENMQMSNDQLNKELDKMLELFKKLELEQKASDIAQQLENLSKKQDQAQNQPDAPKQNQLNKEFENIKKDLEQLNKLNQEQKEHLDLKKPNEQKEEIEKSMKKASENLEQNQQDPAKKQQQKASDGMKEMAENLRSQMMQMQMQQTAEDINTIRRILSNLIKLSKDQEDLMQKVKITNENDTKYLQLVQQQQNIKEQSLIIEDSLTALGKRVFQLQTYISDELYKLKRDLKKSTTLLEDKQRGPASAAQQYAMTSTNNLALMLSETMNQMQQQMNKKGGSGSCSNPGGSKPKPGPGEMKDLQDQLGKDLDKMGKQLKEGQSGTQINKELAGMAQRQAEIRESLRKMKDNMSQQQKKESKIDELLDDMDKNETDIVNKRIQQQTLLRQKNIETKMLELDKALREQDEKDDRTSNTAQDIPVTTPPQLEDFLKNKKSKLNISKNLPPELKPFYKNLVIKYDELK